MDTTVNSLNLLDSVIQMKGSYWELRITNNGEDANDSFVGRQISKRMTEEKVVGEFINVSRDSIKSPFPFEIPCFLDFLNFILDKS